MMTNVEYVPPPLARPTLSYANCYVSEPAGYRPLHLDLHIPPGDGPFPVVLWVHGGGWMSGSRVMLPETVAPYGFHERMVARGYAVADVDYRLALEAAYPSQLVDVQSAIRWLRHYSGQLGLDPGRFAALGESAGAHLAMMAGLAGQGELALQAVVNWYGPAHLTFRDADDPASNLAILLGGPLSERMEFARWASPLHNLHDQAPPLLSVHGTDDDTVPVEHAVLLTEGLRQLGVRADLITADGAGHCFQGHPDIGGLIESCIDFLDDVLK
jgi:acetyl esterase/lipase